ncbi:MULTISPECIES: D-aminoacyl-tRNA deacylase [unclassified Psychrobacillus]|uniref:D-aminoacyl-tRNA deacylase n=1 Tax=unclassified Psychrobacillus TaxID=2636677 RepID=UPI001469F900|nr:MULTISPECIES: D-aminoacyl-tRNA deacylase [unclassified Psychrobacillus]MCM3358469.1 D-aminoacyl-tRNA deacylase [Psychrobacillus sp. MER TA 171]NME04234.1 D-tyrosyl-tRNA(Tyr) deacylase [Psychrobacillus sp. BL-248-WT-3]
MKVVLQRCKNAKVTVDGEITGQIDHGYMLLVGITTTDTEKEVDYLVEKIAGLRLFEDQDGKMNHSIQEMNGSILSVSQFTLYADTKRGRRPSFIEAARPEQAKPLWELFNSKLQAKEIQVETGIFGAMMDVTFTNDGPVTIVLEA